MEDRMRERLAELRGEYEAGQEQVHLLEQRREELHGTLLRISGAIQVLEELLVSREAVTLRPAAVPVTDSRLRA
ncbi:MAG: hypothetical protein IT429_00780 [Gemmataceae bacterium]|nr:hypothetical protein [Gemmataceae bacterium]